MDVCDRLCPLIRPGGVVVKYDVYLCLSNIVHTLNTEHMRTGCCSSVCSMAGRLSQVSDTLQKRYTVVSQCFVVESSYRVHLLVVYQFYLLHPDA